MSNPKMNVSGQATAPPGEASITISSPSSADSSREARSASSALTTVLLSVAAVPEPDRELAAVGGDGQRDHHAGVGQVLPVEHQHLDVLARQVACEQFRPPGRSAPVSGTWSRPSG